MTIVDRIYLLLEKNNTTGKELAKYVGISAGTVSDWKNKGTFPSSKYIEKIADFFNTTAQFLITGETIETEYDFSDTDLELIKLFNSLDKKQQTIITGKLLEYEYDNKKAQIKEHSKQLKVAESKKYTTNAEIIPIEKILLPVTPQPASAGIGKYMLDDDSFEKMEFDLDYRTQKADHAIIVDGDSMYPTIENGEYIFVREQQTVEHNEVGIFVYEDKVYCKRLHIDYKKKQLTLLSDNEDYDDIPIENIDNLRTIGKVIL